VSIENALKKLNTLINYEKGFKKYGKRHYQPSKVADILGSFGIDTARLAVVHVAGTKGKGSVSRYLAEMLRLSGKTTGLFTSPHLFRLNERISVNGENIADNELEELIERYFEEIKKLRASYFEALCTLAILYFIRQSCDVIVLETGLGGRLDATNFHPKPLLSVITPISLDHTALLGHTITAIAGEKAGIIKSDVPVISARQSQEAKAVIGKRAAANRSKLSFVDEIYQWKIVEKGEDGSRVKIGTKTEIHISQWGEVFVENFMTALAAFRALAYQPDEDLLNRAGSLRFPFYIRKFGNMIVDVSHNDASLKALFRTLREYSSLERPTLCISVLWDKELDKIAGVVRSFQSDFREIIVFDFESPRPSGGRELFEKIKDIPAVSYVAEIEKLPSQPPIVLTGSFYSIPAIVRHFNLQG